MPSLTWAGHPTPTAIQRTPEEYAPLSLQWGNVMGMYIAALEEHIFSRRSFVSPFNDSHLRFFEEYPWYREQMEGLYWRALSVQRQTEMLSAVESWSHEGLQGTTIIYATKT